MSISMVVQNFSPIRCFLHNKGPPKVRREKKKKKVDNPLRGSRQQTGCPNKCKMVCSDWLISGAARASATAPQDQAIRKQLFYSATNHIRLYKALQMFLLKLPKSSQSEGNDFFCQQPCFPYKWISEV